MSENIIENVVKKGASLLIKRNKNYRTNEIKGRRIGRLKCTNPEIGEWIIELELEDLVGEFKFTG